MRQEQGSRRRGQKAEVTTAVRAPGGAGIAQALWAVCQIVWHLLATPFIGRRRLHWGATPDEAAATLPGDNLIPHPKWGFTYGVSVDAPPESVWPWVVQIGQGRGGFYSYQTLENMFGCKIHNTARVMPEHQHPNVGDEVRLHPKAPAMRIAVHDEPAAFVLHGAPADVGSDGSFAASTWQFALVPQTSGATRLLMRGRSEYSADLVSRISFGRLPLEPIMFVMSRKMLREITRLAEAAAHRSRPEQ
jgi:hypothetical protein